MMTVFKNTSCIKASLLSAVVFSLGMAESVSAQTFSVNSVSTKEHALALPAPSAEQFTAANAMVSSSAPEFIVPWANSMALPDATLYRLKIASFEKITRIPSDAFRNETVHSASADCVSAGLLKTLRDTRETHSCERRERSQSPAVTAIAAKSGPVAR